MAITRAQAFGANASAATTVATPSVTLAARSLVVVFACTHGTTNTISDTNGNTWVKGTDNANIPSSSKHYIWFWCLSSKAGATTITVNGGTSGTQFVQGAEYTGQAAWMHNAAGDLNAASTATTIAITGTVTAGDLVLMGEAPNTESTSTYSVTAGDDLTAFVLDGASKTCGQLAGAETAGFGEKLGATSGSRTYGLTSTVNTGHGAQLIAFTPLAPPPLDLNVTRFRSSIY